MEPERVSKPRRLLYFKVVKTKKKQDQYTVYERHGQLVLAMNSEIMIPENALSAQLEELEYGKLYEAYSPKGRKSAADPRVLFKVLVHGYLCGIYSSRKLEEACQYRIDFRWLLEDRNAPDHSTLARFRTGRCKEAVADAGYESLENYLYLDQRGQVCLIKPTNYEQKKTKKFQKQVGRIENMPYHPEEDNFTCTQGRKLHLRREETEARDGRFVSTAWYRCEDCSSRPYRAQCRRAKDPGKPKELVLQKTFCEKRAQATENITTERGIHLRLCRSTQVEGAFLMTVF